MDNHHKQLSDIVERLEAVQNDAPTKTTYAMGKTESSISSRLLDIIRDLKAMIATENEPVETELVPETVPAKRK